MTRAIRREVTVTLRIAVEVAQEGHEVFSPRDRRPFSLTDDEVIQKATQGLTNGLAEELGYTAEIVGAELGKAYVWDEQRGWVLMEAVPA